MKEFKRFIRLTIKVYKMNEITEDEAVNNIANWARNKEVFNWWSFYYGVVIGMILTKLLLWILSMLK